MDQKRLFIAIAVSIGILLIFEMWNRPTREAEQRRLEQQRSTQVAPATPAQLPAGPAGGAAAPATPGTATAAATPATPEQRIRIEAPRVSGSINLRGARIDDLVLLDHRETVARNSPPVRLLAPRTDVHPYFVQWGWSAADGRTRVPDADTDWSVEGGPLGVDRPVTLSWDNGQGQVFRIRLEIDRDYMLAIRQSVQNRGTEAVQLLPWTRIRRDATPEVAGFFILHEGFVGVLDGRLVEWTYKDAKAEAEKRRGPAFETESAGGWAGFTDKYWLTALMPQNQATRVRTAFRHINDGRDRWQADMALPAAETIAPGAEASFDTRTFAGAKEVNLLDAYASRYGIVDFDKAVDFGWFYFLTKPFFHILHFLGVSFGNFGVAILVFTLCLKILFFPLANKSYKSMARMKVLGPKMSEIKERHKDDPAKAQAEMMALYRSEKVNPASGCLPILIQIPVFFALYKVLFVTIEMRHAPFFGWIQDLSAPDPTNLFNLFGLLPFDPAHLSSLLHMPAWAIAMGLTMFLQYKLNPAPPDPIQAKLFAWMPLIFTFMLAGMPAGLVIYWTWNNLLSISQQWWIMRMDREEQKKRGTYVAPVKPEKAAKKG
ncbi:membrane protein insertase YidC [Falsiroseomonas sp. HW251]|uniref:membrane protein insertase YidC n=1 Tax=Falsiroseomonas sp. HW251 TaxID=3390998 RepID=UPI003D31B13C